MRFWSILEMSVPARQTVVLSAFCSSRISAPARTFLKSKLVVVDSVSADPGRSCWL